MSACPGTVDLPLTVQYPRPPWFTPDLSSLPKFGLSSSPSQFFVSDSMIHWSSDFDFWVRINSRGGSLVFVSLSGPPKHTKVSGLPTLPGGGLSSEENLTRAGSLVLLTHVPAPRTGLTVGIWEVITALSEPRTQSILSFISVLCSHLGSAGD